ncbi:M81 family metallopeptidase [Kiloniella laminariae]|uniref:M81 family metallopeptidase n=1 Tax=Kiloniella laminariae TaxID=454162 RepID=UPI0003714F62|nr:M81 family metallopeptidase [Kiloniella laminariae]
MRVFCASIATETNTFSPLRTDMSDFRESFYAAPGDHPETPTLCSAVMTVCRKRAAEEGWTLIEGTATWAEPGGLVNRATWEHLRDEVLDQLRAALPLEAVILGLHGAMVAQDYPDCEGDLLQRVRQIVGPDVTIGATLDPHSHLTPLRVENADLLVAFKEFPHTDFVDAAVDCVDLVLRTLRKEITPTKAVFDCRMIEVLPTSLEPMRSFVDKQRSLEGHDDILSISTIHGFMAGDVPEMGSKMLVITDNAPEKAQSLARQLGEELFSFRGKTRPEFLVPGEAFDRAAAIKDGPVVIADVWDNPGGGVPGDSTVLLHHALQRGLTSVAVGTIWDPMAVRTCISAGEGASLQLRFGGKTSASAGAPIDGWVEVKKIVRNATQSFGDSIVPLGDAVVIRIEGIDVILNTNRAQAFEPDLFSNMGIDPASKKLLIVKSTNHFHRGFARIASQILYANVEGPYPSNPETNAYQNLRRAIWPIHPDPHNHASE